MQTFRQRMFLRFFLQHNTGARTPAALQVDRTNVIPLRTDRRGRQRPAPFEIGIEVRDGGYQYIKPLARQPRTA